MKWIERLVKKKKNPQAVYTIIYNANNRQFVDTLTEEQRNWLVNYIKEIKPEECICCPCFAWRFKENKVVGCLCTLGGIPNESDKGQCNF